MPLEPSRLFGTQCANVLGGDEDRSGNVQGTRDEKLPPEIH